jgi:hypothetical protein
MNSSMNHLLRVLGSFGHPGGGPKQVTQQRFISFENASRVIRDARDGITKRCIGACGLMSPNDHTSFVVVDQVARNLAFDDFAKTSNLLQTFVLSWYPR